MRSLLPTAWMKSFGSARSGSPAPKAERAPGDSTLGDLADSRFGGGGRAASRRYALKRLPISLP